MVTDNLRDLWEEILVHFGSLGQAPCRWWHLDNNNSYLFSALLYIINYPNETLYILVVTMWWHLLTEASQEKEQVLWVTLQLWILSLRLMRKTQWVYFYILVFTQRRVQGCSWEPWESVMYRCYITVDGETKESR